MVKETFSRNKPSVQGVAAPVLGQVSTYVTTNETTSTELWFNFESFVSTGFIFMLYASYQVSNGVMSVPQSALRLVAAKAVISPAINFQDASGYKAKFGVLPEGVKLFMKLRLVYTATGQVFDYPTLPAITESE